MDSVHLISRYFPNLTEVQQKQFAQLGGLYKHWNSQINVISRKDMDHFYERHVLHSLGIAKVVSFAPGARVLDVGTGGGFPGIPLAILFPETQFLLVDSIGKKIKVVQEVSDSLGLGNVHARQQRAEDVPEKVHFVVSRAVTRFKPFWVWIRHVFDRDQIQAETNGVFYLKGGDLREELQELGRPTSQFYLTDHFESPFFETKQVVYCPA